MSEPEEPAYTEEEWAKLNPEEPPEQDDPAGGEPSHPETTPDQEGGDGPFA